MKFNETASELLREQNERRSTEVGKRLRGAVIRHKNGMTTNFLCTDWYYKEEMGLISFFKGPDIVAIISVADLSSIQFNVLTEDK